MNLVEYVRDVQENHKLYAAIAGKCSCDKCEGESWYVDPENEE